MERSVGGPIRLRSFISFKAAQGVAVRVQCKTRSIGTRYVGLRLIAAAISCFLIFCIGGVAATAQAVVRRIDPSLTGPAIEMVRGNHLAVYDTSVPSRHLLLLFLVGTRSNPESSLALDTAFATWGFHAISLDYENGVLAASCGHSTDSACFDHYRETIVTGAAGSDKIAVTPENSILNRVEKLLGYLAQTDPGGGWGEFVRDHHPRWDRIIVAGHSQGSGHAAYLGKMFRVNRVLMFSGPQDYLDDFHRPAPWQFRGSATPAGQYFAFLNKHDPFNVEHQIANCAALMNLESPQPLPVASTEQIKGYHQILVNDVQTAPHNSTLLPQFEYVWKYMATAEQ